MGRLRAILVCACALAALLATVTAPATAAKLLHYAGRAVAVPAAWPVYRLAERPGDVRAARPPRRLPGDARRQPRLTRRARSGGGGQCVVDPPWPAPLSHPRLAPSPTRPASAGSAPPGGGAGPTPFTGLGFDACATPSTKAMSAWAASPYRAIGVYIGGADRGCSQPNLTTAWVAAEVAAGWHLIPTYVGLQAPTSSCGSCAKLSANKASAQGAAAANDAVADAQSVGMNAGSPIYFDMEGYTRTSKASGATLAFLAAWTKRLHALGYRLRRLQQQLLRDRRPRRPDRLRLRAARRHLDRQLERPRRHRRPLRSERRLVPPPAAAPVPRRPQRDLRRGEDQHRQRLRRRGDGRHARLGRRPLAVAGSTPSSP